MNVPAFLANLRERDIHMLLEGDRLKCNAPAGTLTPELREELRKHKNAILEYLHMVEMISRQQKAIVPLQPNGTLAPVFAVAGHNGDVFAYRDLVKYIGNEQPFFGLHPPGLDGKSEPLGRIEALATYFADEIQAFRPAGPYVIAGYCAGGATALELSQELVRRGAEVRFLALFGCPYPTWYGRLQRTAASVPYWARRIALHVREIRAIPTLWQKGRYFVDRIQARAAAMRAQQSPADGQDPVSAMKSKIEHATIAAVRRYKPAPFQGRLCLIVPTRQWLNPKDAVQRWCSVARQAETYFGPDSCNTDFMLLDPDAAHFAEMFKKYRDGN